MTSQRVSALSPFIVTLDVRSLLPQDVGRILTQIHFVLLYRTCVGDNYPVVNVKDSVAAEFFNSAKVREALNFDSVDTKWVGCIPGAGRRRMTETLLPGQTLLAHDYPESMAPYLAELLDEAGIRVLVYAGDRDLTTNLQGSEMVLDRMNWSGKNQWKTADRYLWMLGEDVVGYVKTHKNLDLLLVLNSGHLLPYNVPAPALDIVTRFTSNESFADIKLPKVEYSIPPQSNSDRDTRREASFHGLSLSHILRLVCLLSFVAIVCFICGAVTALRWSNKSRLYTPVPEVAMSEGQF